MPSRAPAANPQAGIATVHTLRRLVSWLLGLVLLAGTGAALGVAVYPVVTGGSALAVLTGSMQPGMPVGAMAFIRPVDAATIEVGEVITFQRRPDAPELVTHRVIVVDDTSGGPVFTTGDTNDAADLDPVPAAVVRGRLWFSVAELGRLAAVLHSDDIDAGEAQAAAIPGPDGATLTDTTVRIVPVRPPVPRQPTPAVGWRPRSCDP